MMTLSLSTSPALGVDAQVVPLILAGPKVDAAGGSKGVQTTLDDGLLTGSCSEMHNNNDMIYIWKVLMGGTEVLMD